MKLSGTPDLSVVAFDTVDPKVEMCVILSESSLVSFSPRLAQVSVYAIADGMKKFGWNLNILQFPACLHIAVTFANAKNADKFVADMNASVAEAVAHPGSFCIVSCS